MALLGLDIASLEQALAGAEGGTEMARRALATALAIDWLERAAVAHKVEWELLARKAQRWLKACEARPASGLSWSELAAALRLE